MKTKHLTLLILVALYALAAVVFTGCASTRMKPAAQVSPAAISVLDASIATAKAGRAVTAAKGANAAAKLKVEQFSAVATPEQRPMVVAAQKAMQESAAALGEVQEQLTNADAALEQSKARIADLSAQVMASATAQAEAEKARRREEEAKQFWRASALKLGLLSLALGIWIFKKPLLALCGVPTL